MGSHYERGWGSKGSERLPFTIKMVWVFNVAFKYECKLVELKGLHLGDCSQTGRKKADVASLGRRVGRRGGLHVGNQVCMCCLMYECVYMHKLKDIEAKHMAETAALYKNLLRQSRALFTSTSIHTGWSCLSASVIISQKPDTSWHSSPQQTLCLLNDPAFTWLPLTCHWIAAQHEKVWV